MSSTASIFKQQDLDILMKQLEIESTPMKLTDLMVDRPCLPCCACYFILLICCMIAVPLNMITPELESERDWGIWDDQIQIDYDRMKLADQYVLDTQGSV